MPATAPWDRCLAFASYMAAVSVQPESLSSLAPEYRRDRTRPRHKWALKSYLPLRLRQSCVELAKFRTMSFFTGAVPGSYDAQVHSLVVVNQEGFGRAPL
jgi:hypothetical protein